jgi:hypothetical protein
MKLSDKAIKEYKEIYKKHYGQDISDEEAQEQGNRLLRVYELLFRHAETEMIREQRLKREKIKGFFLEATDGPYTCGICGESHMGNEIWWNKKGLRCADCWRNIQKKVIPSLDYDSNNKVWIKDWQIQSHFDIHPMTARKMRRLGELVGRDLKRKDGRTYCTVYLDEENKKFLETHPKKPKMKVIYKYPKSDEK